MSELEWNAAKSAFIVDDWKRAGPREMYNIIIQLILYVEDLSWELETLRRRIDD